MITSLFDLDRTVREASVRLARARRALAVRSEWDEPPESPLAPFRSVLRKDTLLEIEGVPDPILVPALRAHLARLVLARVLWDDEARVARAWSEATVRLEEGLRLPALPKEIAPPAGASLLSPRTLLAAVLIDPEDARRRRVAEVVARAARDHLRDPTLRHAERRAAAAAQLGVPLDAFELPAPLPGSKAPSAAGAGSGAPGPALALGSAGGALGGAGGALGGAGGALGVAEGESLAASGPITYAAIEAVAAELLAGTASLMERFAPWDRGMSAAMARDASRGWPAHLSPRWVMSVFAGTDLGRGGSIDAARLPPVLGATSFARGLCAFGEAFGEAAGPTSAPFALARLPVDPRPMRIGALFGLLAGDEVFARRTLELGHGAARDHARSFGRAFGVHLRLAAAAVRTRPSLFPPRADLDDRFREETASAWGEPLPRELAGALPHIAEDTPARFVAALLAALDRAQMIERFDEDWYRNPRSVEALRAIASEPPAPITEELLRKGAAELARVVVTAAG